MTQQQVCGYHTGWASTFLSCLCRGTESCSIHRLDGQKTCSNLSANAPSFLSQTRAHLRLVSSFCQGVLTEWQSCALCYPPTHCICEFSSGGWGWGLSQGTSLLSRVMWRQSDLSDRKKRGKICYLCTHSSCSWKRTSHGQIFNKS